MRWWLCPPRNSVLHIDCIHAHVSQYKQAQTRWQRRAQHPEASLCLSTGTTPTTTQTQTQTHRHRHTDTHTVTGCTRSSRDAERPTCSADVPSVTFSATWLRNPCTPIPCVCIRIYMSVSYIDVYRVVHRCVYLYTGSRDIHGCFHTDTGPHRHGRRNIHSNPRRKSPSTSFGPVRPHPAPPPLHIRRLCGVHLLTAGWDGWLQRGAIRNRPLAVCACE